MAGGREVAHDLVTIYLNDHMAVRRRRWRSWRCCEKDADSVVWREIEGEIREDPAELQRLMTSMSSAQSTLRRAAVWTAEKLGEIKLRVDDLSTGGFSRRLELIEALAIGID